MSPVFRMQETWIVSSYALFGIKKTTPNYMCLRPHWPVLLGLNSKIQPQFSDFVFLAFRTMNCVCQFKSLIFVINYDFLDSEFFNIIIEVKLLHA